MRLKLFLNVVQNFIHRYLLNDFLKYKLMKSLMLNKPVI